MTNEMIWSAMGGVVFGFFVGRAWAVYRIATFLESIKRIR